MADQGLKDHVTTYILAGLLTFSLLTFAISFTFNNNPTALDDGTEDVFNTGAGEFSNKLVGLGGSSNSLLNITSNTNPEVSDLGSRDSVAVGFESSGVPRSYWESAKILVAWVFTGTSGEILLGVMGGLIAMSTVFLIWQFVRQGS